MNPSESQELSPEILHLMEDLDEVQKDKAKWDDARKPLCRASKQTLKDVYHTKRDVGLARTDIKAMHNYMKSSNGDKVVFKSKFFSLTAGSAMAFARVAVILFIMGVSAFGIYIGWYMYRARKEAEKARIEAPILIKYAVRKAICEGKHGPNCTKCVDHPH